MLLKSREQTRPTTELCDSSKCVRLGGVVTALAPLPVRDVESLRGRIGSSPKRLGLGVREAQSSSTQADAGYSQTCRAVTHQYRSSYLSLRGRGPGVNHSDMGSSSGGFQ